MSRRDATAVLIPSPMEEPELEEVSSRPESAESGEIYTGRSLLTEMLKIERTERKRPDDPGISPDTPTGAEVLAAGYEEQVGLAVECAFEKYVEGGNRVTELYGGVFCIARAPRMYV